MSPLRSAKTTLRWRTALLVAFVFLLFTLALYAVFSNILMREFERIETTQMTENVERVLRALENDGRQLIVKTEDWAKWDDTYQYVEDRNQKYQESVLNYETVAALKVDHLLYFDKEGKLFDGYEINSAEERTIPLTEEFVRTVGITDDIKKPATPETMPTGYLSLNDKIIIYASVPIMDSVRSKPIRGALFSTHVITDEFIKGISEQTRLNVSMFPWQKAADFGVPSSVLESLRGSNSILIKPTSPQDVDGWGLVRDYQGKPILLSRVSSTRRIYRQGIEARNVVMICSMLAGIVATAFMILCLNRWVVSRLAGLQSEVNDIEQSGDTERRLTLSGSDELTALAANINSMVEGLHKAKTEILSARDAERSANMAKSLFIARVSHELRTPLHGILGLLRILYKNERSSSKIANIQMAYNTTEGLVETINDLLDMSKAEAGKLTLDPKEFLVRHIVNDSLQTIAPRAHERENVEVVCAFKPDVPRRLFGDPQRLKQIITNLLGNAVKFTNQGSITLTVGVEKRVGEEAVLVVRCQDTGIGIPEEKLKTIFQAYEQADSTMAGKPQGTGLGLSVVQNLAETMGGAVSVKSVLGVGSEFAVRIPFRVIEENQRTYGHIGKVCSLSLSPSFHEAVKAMLSPFEVTPVRVESTSAVPKGKSTCAVVVDSRLLQKSEFWSELMTLRQSSSSKIVVLVTTAELADRERLELLGVDSILVRPCLPDHLYAALRGEAVKTSASETSLTANAMVEGLEPLRVLVADDNKTNRVVIVDLLEEAGHKVQIAQDGQEMIEAWEGTDFDIILTDIEMPRLDGLSATQRIRDLEKKKGTDRKVPIIALTAHAYPEERQQMLSMGINDVITKPIDPAQVRRVFGAVLSHPEGGHAEHEAPAGGLHGGTTQRVNGSAAQVDMDSILARCGGRMNTARLILESFAQSAPELVESLGTDIENQDRPRIKARAHALRGLVLEVNCVPAITASEWIESNAAGAPIEKIRTAYGQLAGQVEQLLEHVGELLRSSAFGGQEDPSRHV